MQTEGELPKDPDVGILARFSRCSIEAYGDIQARVKNQITQMRRLTANAKGNAESRKPI